MTPESWKQVMKINERYPSDGSRHFSEHAGHAANNIKWVFKKNKKRGRKRCLQDVITLPPYTTTSIIHEFVLDQITYRRLPLSVKYDFV